MRCAVVDGYSSARFLPDALRRRRIGTVHVQSAPEVPPIFRSSARLEAFDVNVVHAGDLNATADALRRRNVQFVVAGAESGVELADALAAEMGTPGHGMSCPRARRDKYEMAQALRAAGLAAPDTIKTDSLDEIVTWARTRGSWPVVVKPVDSAATDNVTFCESAEEVSAAFAKIHDSVNVVGGQNTSVLGQEFLRGEEYFVNAVSRSGRHHIAEVWRYQKRRVPAGGYIYDYEEPIRYDSAESELLRPYVRGVLDALQIRNGPSHSEVMLTDRGPVLIETGARFAGSVLPHVVSRCFGTSQVELAALSIGDPAAFEVLQGAPYPLRKHLRYVSLIAPRPGLLTSLDGFAAIRALPSYAEMFLRVGAGDLIHATVDSATSPGYLYLIHDLPRQIERDYATLRALEEDGLYDFSGGTP